MFHDIFQNQMCEFRIFTFETYFISFTQLEITLQILLSRSFLLMLNIIHGICCYRRNTDNI